MYKAISGRDRVRLAVGCGGTSNEFFPAFDASRWRAIALVLSVSVLFALTLVHSAASGADEIVTDEIVTDEEVLDDPLAVEMTFAEIKRRLRAGRKQMEAASDENTRYYWARITQILEMQLGHLESLDQDFSPETIEFPVDTPPYPLSYLDQLRHKQRDDQAVQQQLDQAFEAAQNRISVAEETFLTAKRRFYYLQESGATGEQNSNARLEYELGKESYIYARLDARLINQKLIQVNMNLERIGAIIPEVEANVYFSEQDYDIQRKNLLKREDMLTDALEQTRSELARELEKPEGKRFHAEALKSLQFLLNEAISYLHYENRTWDARRKIYLGQAGAAVAIIWHEENALMQEEISELLQVNELGQQEHTRVLVDKEKKDSVITGTFNVELQKEILHRRQLAFDNLGKIMELLQDYQADLELTHDVRYFNHVKERVQLAVDSIWGLQLAIVQDRAITVGNTVTAILLFILGLQLAKFLVLRFLYYFLKKRKVREAVAYTITQLFFYLVVLILLFGVISYAGIPFRFFAFFGGALAIAAGFGSQKIISNFLSGIILLLEGSIRVGDMVQVDHSKGRVKSIGLRHTQMTTFDNVDILIPNAKFLEENVINWTLESATIRSDFSVGVDFSAPVDLVMTTLVQVAIDHPGVLDEPEPEAFLEQINSDNGYIRFHLYYWHIMKSPRERLVFNSALQIEIINRLKFLGIELASPTVNIMRA